jgi:hypothetical protein
MSALCALAVMLALAGLGVVALSLGLGLFAMPGLLAAPAFGAASMASGLAAAIIALKRGV